MDDLIKVLLLIVLAVLVVVFLGPLVISAIVIAYAWVYMLLTGAVL